MREKETKKRDREGRGRGTVQVTSFRGDELRYGLSRRRRKEDNLQLGKARNKTGRDWC